MIFSDEVLDKKERTQGEIVLVGGLCPDKRHVSVGTSCVTAAPNLSYLRTFIGNDCHQVLLHRASSEAPSLHLWSQRHEVILGTWGGPKLLPHCPSPSWARQHGSWVLLSYQEIWQQQCAHSEKLGFVFCLVGRYGEDRIKRLLQKRTVPQKRLQYTCLFKWHRQVEQWWVWRAYGKRSEFWRKGVPRILLLFQMSPLIP